MQCMLSGIDPASISCAGLQALNLHLQPPVPAARKPRRRCHRQKLLNLKRSALSACRRRSRLIPALGPHTGLQLDLACAPAAVYDQDCKLVSTCSRRASLHTRRNIDLVAVAARHFPCERCNRTFVSSRGVPDLTLTSGIAPGIYQSETFARTEIFRWVCTCLQQPNLQWVSPQMHASLRSLIASHQPREGKLLWVCIQESTCELCV